MLLYIYIAIDAGFHNPTGAKQTPHPPHSAQLTSSRRRKGSKTKSCHVSRKVSRSEEGEVIDGTAHNPKNTNTGEYLKTAINNSGSAGGLNNVTKGDYTCGLKIFSKGGFLHRIKNVSNGSSARGLKNTSNIRSTRHLKNDNNSKSTRDHKNVNNSKSVRDLNDNSIKYTCDLKNANNGKYICDLKNISSISDGGSFCDLKNVNKSNSVRDHTNVNGSNGGVKPVDDTAARCVDLKNG
ncbi:hypothetical protein CFC21_106117 [Triticum aestivum]|uniref:Uncharacterized protein n=2 Tax=Triticum aestivum TaxID=4565 RepID=A0A9R1MDH4_WHEAT|nr:hypothetical protein CFC21_106116 [Triticum aestivum]KAF7105292.1 hypothetical protein CFC21_106117 [Triticum aestivum]